MGVAVQRAIALAVTLSFAACGPTWPHQATAVTSARVEHAPPVQTIDILPLDLEVWTDPRIARDAGDVRIGAEARIVGVATETLYRRGYAVGAVMDWDGSYVGGDGASQVALAPHELLATVDSLASYGTAVGDAKALPVPHLPVRLGQQTGADATLYVGGWAFAGMERKRGALVGKIILGTVLVVGIVAIAIIAAKGSDKLDGLGKVVGGAARTVATTAASAGRAAIKATGQAGNLIIHVGDALARSPEGAELAVDAMGHAITHLTLVSGRPEWSTDPTLPHRGKPRMYLEMTLVDNRNGTVLWHAHQQFPANAARPGDVMKAAKLLLASLPPR